MIASCLLSAVALATLPMLALPSPAPAGQASPTYDIPLLRDVQVDGVTNDWAENVGLRVDILAPPDRVAPSASDLQASVRIGWNESGLLLFVRVSDDEWVEHQDPRQAGDDSIEVFLAKEPGASDLCRWTFSPGMSAGQPIFGSTLDDLRRKGALKGLPAEARAERVRDGNTCLVEILLPWESLAIAPETGRTVGFQIRVTDADATGEAPLQAAWYPGTDTESNPDHMHRLRLSSRRAAPPVQAVARSSYAWPAGIRVAVLAPLHRAGTQVAVMSMGRVLAEGVLGAAAGYASAELRFSVSDLAGFERWVDVHVDGELAGAVLLPVIRADPMSLRLLDDPEESAHMPAAFLPSLLTDDVETASTLTIDTDERVDVLGGRPSVAVEILGPGGETVAAREALLGEEVSFGTRGWPDGPYEVRLCVTSDGRPLYRYLPFYRGRWLAQSADIMTECLALPGDDTQPTSLVYRFLKRSLSGRLDSETDSITGPADHPHPGWKSVHGLLMEHREIRRGTNAVVRPGGTVRLAWIDPVDDSAQYAVAHLPPGYDAGRTWPLIVDLHGYNPLDPEYTDWPGVDARHHPLADSYGVIVLRPHGRGNMFYEGIGELDVLTALHRAKGMFAADPERVYLVGESMGAAGCIHLGSRHPHLFAAIAPIAGAGRDYRVRMDPDRLRRVAPRERFRLERRSSYAQAEGLATTPVFVNVGDADEFGFVKEARFFVGLMQRWGYDIRYREHPGKGHWDLECRDDVASWLLSHTLQRDPRRVRIRAARLKSANAHWVRVRQRADPFSFIHADVRAIDRHTIRLRSENVLQVTLSPGTGIVDRDRPLRVIWNGVEQPPLTLGEGTLTLTSPAYKPGDIVKTASREGPMEDFHATPFAIVVGTMAKDPRMDRFLRSRAEALRQSWRDRQHVDPRFFLDSEITEKDIHAYSLLLVGGPEENLVTKIFADRFPLTVEGSRITIDGRAFDAPDAAVCMIYPHPLNQDRYILLNTATSADGLFHAALAPGDRDFAVVDARGEILSGIFDYRWRFTERYVDYGDAAERLATRPRQVPRHQSAATGDAELFLDELLELQAWGSFLDMLRGADHTGRPLALGDLEFEKGIAVNARPGSECSTVYDLAAGGWQRLTATVGIRTTDRDKSGNARPGAAAVTFLVLGDGKPLYESPAFERDSSPVQVDVDVSGIQLLTLVVRSDAASLHTTTAAIWGNARLGK